jgi:hypothetical protein
MPLNTSCDHCGQALQVLEEHSGKQVRCPKCYQVFVAKPAAAAPSVPAPAPAPASGDALVPSKDAPPPSPSPAPEGGAKFCPHCGIQLFMAVAFCPGCGKPPGPLASGDGSVAASSYPYNAPAPYYSAPATSGLATASVVLGGLAWACGGPLFSIPGVICGHIARKQIRESGGTMAGDGVAIAGLVLSYLNVVLMGLLIALAVAGNL